MLPAARFRVVFDPACTVLVDDRLSVDSSVRPHWFRAVPLSGFALRLAGWRLTLDGGSPGSGSPVEPVRCHLWIPSLEFFSRCYGSSQEVKRILLTYHWDEVQRRFFAPFDAASLPESRGLPVRYGTAASRLLYGDAVFLAHVFHDIDGAEACAERLNSAMAAAKVTSDKSGRLHGPHLDIGPWFFSEAELIVRGLPLASGDFLALRIVKCEDPAGQPVEIVQFDGRDSGAGPKPESPDPTPVPVRSHYTGDVIREVSDPAPAWGSSEAWVADADLPVLGSAREIWRVRLPGGGGQASRKRVRSKEEEAEQYSGADPAGLSADTGLVTHYSRRVLPAEGVLNDVWNALRAFQARLPGCIRTVEWFTPDTQFSSSPPPQLLLLRSPHSYASLKASRWVCLDPDSDPADCVLRGLLVIRVVVSRSVRSEGPLDVYIVEIQRRSPPQVPDSFSGLVFDLRHGVDLQVWIDVLLARLPGRAGVFPRLMDDCRAELPGRVDVFRHTSSRNEPVAGATAVRNALAKMDVVCP